MRYAIVGAGSRHAMYREALVDRPIDPGNELVALCDVNARRLALSVAAIAARERPAAHDVGLYDPADFERMIAERRPDTVIVTTPDYLHDEYILRALHAGCDVITEKPMTIDLGRLRRIVDAQRETRRTVTVTFNYRYTPSNTQLKDVLLSGAIGEVTAVDFRWSLDRVHGADYFRRWHRERSRSGGLLVHKATHHFDLVNWWIASRPVTVTAIGSRRFYNEQTADRLGLAGHGERCRGCPVGSVCDYRLDLADDRELKGLYLDAEDADGYLRDRCIFSSAIDIDDTMQVQVGYANGVSMNYSLCAYSPWEGYEIVFHGTDGELDHRHVGVHGIFGGRRHEADDDATTTVLHRHGEAPRSLAVWTGEGDHGGGDPVMLDQLLNPRAADDPYRRGASHVDGAWSILTGIGANVAMGRRQTVRIDELLVEAGIRLERDARIGL
jgi:predicted dehydrogenase